MNTHAQSQILQMSTTVVIVVALDNNFMLHIRHYETIFEAFELK